MAKYAKNDKQSAVGKMTTTTDKEISKWWMKLLGDAQSNVVFKNFQETADDIADFLTGLGDRRNYFYSLRDLKYSQPPDSLALSSNKVDEFIRTILSEIHYQNPDRNVKMRTQIGEDFLIKKAHQETLEGLLNWGADRSNLYEEQECAFTEGLISGLSVQFTTIEEDVVKTEYCSIKDFVMDASVSRLADVPWMAKKCRMTKSKLVEIYPKANKFYSGKSNPLEVIDYWVIYSKVGVFGGIRNEHIDEGVQKKIDKDYGDYVKIVLLESEFYKPEHERKTKEDGVGGPRLIALSKWEIPFYESNEEGNDFPFTLDYFGRRFGSVFPISPLKSALPGMRAINHIISKLASFIENIRARMVIPPTLTNKEARDFKSKKTFAAVKGSLGGEGFEMLQSNPDASSLLEALQLYEAMVDRRIGLEAIRYITSSQSRSSADAQARMSVAGRAMERYAAAASQAMNKAARKEAFGWRSKGNKNLIKKVIGEVGAELWTEYLDEYKDEDLANEFDVFIRADAARLPNRSNEKQLRIAFAQKIQAILGQYIAVNPQNLNILNYWLQLEWREIGQNPGEFMPIQPPVAPMPPPGLDVGGEGVAPQEGEVA